MNFASISGGVAQFTAAQLPQRDDPFPADIVAAADGWESLLDAWQLPAGIDPARGFIASANARPNENRPVIGFLFSPPARRDRISELLKQNSQIGIADMIRIQRDVHRNSALAERDCLLAWAAEAKIAAQTGPLAAIPNWNGDYDADSKGALAFELLFYHLACALVIKRKRRAYAAAWANRELIWSDIRESYPEPRAAAMRTAVRRAARDFRPGATWGSRHRIRLAHMLGAIPSAGRRWRALDIPASGTSETIMKTAHPMTNRRHAARYGSVARHISDMADPDANFFALLGGNDGWLGSTTAIDQAALWQAGEYICVPLSPETVRTTFAHQTVLTP
jgi:penicillin amidase